MPPESKLTRPVPGNAVTRGVHSERSRTRRTTVSIGGSTHCSTVRQDSAISASVSRSTSTLYGTSGVREAHAMRSWLLSAPSNGAGSGAPLSSEPAGYRLVANGWSGHDSPTCQRKSCTLQLPATVGSPAKLQSMRDTHLSSSHTALPEDQRHLSAEHAERLECRLHAKALNRVSSSSLGPLTAGPEMLPESTCPRATSATQHISSHSHSRKDSRAADDTIRRDVRAPRPPSAEPHHRQPPASRLTTS